VSQFLSTVIASERCFCVVFPLKAQRVLSARRMGVVIGVTSLVLVGGLVAIAGHKHTMACLIDPLTNHTTQIVYVTQ
jgi:predicted cation transporter